MQKPDNQFVLKIDQLKSDTGECRQRRQGGLQVIQLTYFVASCGKETLIQVIESVSNGTIVE